jgi:hypothetical protein
MSFDQEPDADLHGECALEIRRLESKNKLLRDEVEAIRDAIWGINYGSEDFHKNMRKADEIRDMRLKLDSKGESGK